MYTGFNPNAIRPSINHSDLLFCAIEYKNKAMLEALSKSTAFDNKHFCTFWRLASEKKLTPLVDACNRYMELHLNEIVRDAYVFEHWDKPLLQAIKDKLEKPYDTWCRYASWLEILWFSHHAKFAQLKSQAVENLKKLLNVENVVSVLVASHATGEKGLRSVCVDFIVQNGVNVSTYQSMKNSSGFDQPLAKITDLSQSLKGEVETKVKTTVGNLKQQIPNEKVGFLKQRKQTCSLCKRVVKKEDLSKQLLPSVLVGQKKVLVVCGTCSQLAELVGAGPAGDLQKAPSKSLGISGEIRGASSKSNLGGPK